MNVTNAAMPTYIPSLFTVQNFFLICLSIVFNQVRAANANKCANDRFMRRKPKIKLFS